MVRAERTVYVKGDPDAKVLGDCPFCHRTLLNLELKGLDYGLEYIDLGKKPEFIFKDNPKGAVPVLLDGEKWIPDSAAICDYICDTYPPSDAPCVIEGVAEKLFPTFVAFATAGAAEMAEKEGPLVEQLQQLNDYLEQNGPFLGGEAMSPADAMLFPRLYHCLTVLSHYKRWSLPTSLGKVQEYFDVVKTTDAFKNTDYGEDMIIQGWKGKAVQV